MTLKFEKLVAIIEGVSDPREAAMCIVAELLEPTRDMIGAGETAVEDSIDSSRDSCGSYDVWDATTVANAAYRAMLAAALPTPTNSA